MVYLRNTLVMFVLACSCSLMASVADAQRAEPPVVLGTLAGTGAGTPQPAGVQIYGTDLGWTFTHDDQLFVLFGDTWRDQSSVCSIVATGWPSNDDAEGRMPLSWQPSDQSMPPVTYLQPPGVSNAFSAIQVLRDGISLNMGLDRTPLTGFSDGQQAVGAFQTATFMRCQVDADNERSCPAPYVCQRNIGHCLPSAFDIPQLCDPDSNMGCVAGQFCISDDVGFCTDPSSSQPDASQRVPLEIELSVPRPQAETKWESQYTFRTNKFMNMTARTVRSLSGDAACADYSAGTGTLLIWGRPGFYAGPGFEPGLYLLAHDLPLQRDAAGKLLFQPRYFTGVDPQNRPRWSTDQRQAAPLALDGHVNGSARETVSTVNQMAISWLGDPINKWVMLYGGGSGTVPWVQRADNGAVPAGTIAVRFADTAWGPWSAPQTHWAPGAPDQPGTPLGPGGVLFDPLCVDRDPQTCTRSDPTRPSHVFNRFCQAPPFEMDNGFFYAPNIIDAYTHKNDHGGLDVYWNVSTWNPYRVLLVRSSFYPETQP